MSETGRQDFTDKAAAALKPDSQKTGTEKMGDSLKGTADSVASTFEPNSHKSASQRVGDNVSSNSNENDESMLAKAKNAVGLGQK
ncbi:heat shock protein 9/12-domain-containing protein [Mycena rebaudengoi]|nr:heat shock protein 9/12-domain-containing protein [Mycena rebaudengoi]KAJ7273324.1 heat shock protein 9/12-domain-containing protein [Mycena rebaudengoi]